MPGAIDAIRFLTSKYDVHLITSCDTDGAEAAVLAALRQAGIVDDGVASGAGGQALAGGYSLSINRWKCLFCSSGVGLHAICRQLETHTHIDVHDSVALKDLARFIPERLAITSDPQGLAAGGAAGGAVVGGMKHYPGLMAAAAGAL